jgi:hypothetical protein
MGTKSKSFTLVLILILAISSLSLIMVKPANAQSMPKPSVPEFNVKWLNQSYTVPVSYSIDPYTGQSIKHPSYYADNSSIQITIKNQPFVPYKDTINGWTISLFYNIREKGHYTDKWKNIYLTDELPVASYDSQYTVYTYPVQHYSNAPDEYYLGSLLVQITEGGQVDFQVQAMIGYVHRILQGSFAPYYFNGTQSDWSPTQTVTIPASNVSPNPTVTPSPTPTVPEFSLWAIPLLLTIMVASAGLLVYHKKHKYSLVQKA